MPKLYLSHKKTPEVYVCSKDVAQLKKYHFNGIRSIYGTYLRKFKGTILNYKHVKPAIVVYSFLSAMKNIGEIKLPILIICTEKSICDWNYYMSKLSAVKVLTSTSDRSIFDSNDCVILCSIENLNALKPFAGHSWSFAVIDDIDLVVGKMIIKQVSGNFNIAITTKDFIGDDKDYKTQWHILNWSNPKLFGKINEFEKFDKLHYNNLRNLYDDIWHDIDLNVDDDMLDQLESDEKEYNKLLNEWGSRNGFYRNRGNSQTNVRKRKSNFFKYFQEKKRGKKGNNYDSADETKSNNEEDISEQTVPTVQKLKRKSVSFVETVAKKKMLETKSKSTNVLGTSFKELFEDAWIEGFMVDINIPDEFTRNKRATKNKTADEIIVFTEDTNQKPLREFPADKEEDASTKPITNTETNAPKSDNLIIKPIQEILTDKKESDTTEITPKRDHIVMNPLAELLRDISTDFFDDFDSTQQKNIETNDESTDDENPILSAIINGSPLKDAMKKEELKSPKRRIKMRNFEETETVESASSVKANDFLRSLFGDEAVIVEDEPSIFGEERSGNLPYIRVKGVEEINVYTSSQNFKGSFDLEDSLSCSQRLNLMSSLFDI